MGIPKPESIGEVELGPAIHVGPTDTERIRQAKDGDVVPVSEEFVKAGCPMPVEIKPGPKLDQAVAEAIGWFLRDDGVLGGSWHSAARQEAVLCDQTWCRF